MANALENEESGFFNAEEFTSEEGQISYDRVYTAEQFCSYFALFVGNGVFVSPENQLLVSAGENEGSVGRTIAIDTGWAFINGMFYHNKEMGFLDIYPNNTGVPRKDGVFCRYSKASRSINIYVEEGRYEPHRLDYEWELMLATIDVPPFTTSITNANITDTRPNETVCGFVKGLVDVIETDQLFQQFQAQFGEWFTHLQEFFDGDALGTVMSRIEANTLNITKLQNDKVDKTTYEERVKEVDEALDKKANLSKIVYTSISSVGWVGNSAPYTYTMVIEGVKENMIVELGLRSTATADQVRYWMNASIVDGGQEEGKIILKSYGMKPEGDIPVVVILRGDV